MKEIFIDVKGCSNDFITAIESDNNSDIYKIVLTENDRRIDLTNKTVNMAYVLNGTKEGEVMNLNITSPAEGEITLVITEILTRREGNYTCQIVVLGDENYRKHTNYFNLSIRENLFNKISGEIIDSPSLGVLQELVKKAEFLNTQLENKNNVAESLNTNLAENIKLADPLNTSLGEKIPEAATKKSELESSIVEAKKFIDGLDGSQNIPGIRMELTELQNGLKSNQALSYEGSSISANDTLEGRTEGMKIKGRTLNNLIKGGKGTFVIDKNENQNIRIYTFKVNHNLVRGKKYVGYIQVNSMENVTSGLRIYGWSSKNGVDGGYFTCAKSVGVVKFKWNTSVFPENAGEIDNLYLYVESNEFNNGAKLTFSNFMLFEEGTDLTYIDKYFEGLKSFGEAEQEGDKYKITLLSHGKNFIKLNELDDWNGGSLKPSFKCNNGEFSYSVGENDKVGWAIEKKINIKKGVNLVLSLQVKSTFTDGGSGWVGIYYRTGSKWSYFGNYITPNTAYRKFEFKGVVPNEAEECVLRIYNYSQKSGTSYFKDIQVEEGEVATSYEVYKGDKKDILISAPLPGFDFGEDIMYEENGQVKITRNIDTYTFTGDETIRDTTEQDEKSGTGKYKVFVLTINKTIDKNKNINNNFPKKQFSVAFQKVDSEGLAITQYGVYIKILKSKLSTQDTEGLKAWLKANTTTIYFARATPVTEIVENCIDIDLDTFQEKTYFNILNSLPGTLDFRVPSNLGTMIQNMSKEINNIWDVIDMLVAGLLDTKKDLARKTIKNNLK